jgi:hypothetical protein
MRTRDLLPIVFAALALAACGKDDPTPKPAAGTGTGSTTGAIPMPDGGEAPAEEHDHGPRHGGTVVELGEHEAHLEFLHDAAAGTLTAYVYDAEMAPVATEAPMINLSKGVQIPMSPLSGAAPTTDAWKATHDALKEALDGRLRVKIGDRTYQALLAP